MEKGPKIFVTHSVAPWELAIVNGVADAVAKRGATPFFPYREWNPKRIPRAVSAQIKEADYIIAIATKDGQHLDWVNRELAYNLRLSPPKPVLVLADHGSSVMSGYDVIRIHREKPFLTLALVGERIQKLVEAKRNQKILQGFLVGSLLLLLAWVGYAASKES